jgi:hypothetical protein
MKAPSRSTFKTVVVVWIALLSFTSITIKAQHSITISDTSFARILREKFPACMTGNQMDTTCPGIRYSTSLDLGWTFIEDLTGLQYFTGLTNLAINNSVKPIKFMPPLSFPNLTSFDCNYNNMATLPALTFPKLKTFNCWGNFNDGLKTLPDLNFPLLETFVCPNNSLTTLTNLTAPNLKSFYCSGNKLTEISLNYPKLVNLNCPFNQLTFLPPLPSTLCSLDCSGNKLTTLPPLPDLLCGLYCDSNKITCFPTFPLNLAIVIIQRNPFKCLPNHIASMSALLQSFPICKDGDVVNNPYNCSPAQGITGYVFKDDDSDCILDPGESFGKNIPVKLYDASNALLAQTITLSDGSYQFVTPVGSYKVRMDATGTGFVPSCKDNSVVAVENGKLVEQVNIGIKCGPGYDIGVQSIVTKGRVFPGQVHTVSILAGDMSKWYNLNCAPGIGGKIEVKLIGPVTYNGSSGTLSPTVAGNTFTYMIADFSTLNPGSLALVFLTNTSAVAGNFICMEVHITPVAGDINSTNNDKLFCYPVSNSYDPNIKEVYPLDQVEEGYSDWFTYTIHFQNTGNAPAINVKLRDALDPNLDLETFQVLNYSHYNKITLTGSALEINFPTIELADSATNPEGSKGFIQYRIKPRQNLMTGEIVKNTASIYFDFNAPIVTNTTMNHYVKSVSIEENKKNVFMYIYPNPGNGLYSIEISGEIATAGLAIEVYDLLGSVVYRGKTTAALTSIDLIHQPSGIYFIKVTGSGQSFNQRLIKQ